MDRYLKFGYLREVLCNKGKIVSNFENLYPLSGEIITPICIGVFSKNNFIFEKELFKSIRAISGLEDISLNLGVCSSLVGLCFNPSFENYFKEAVYSDLNKSRIKLFGFDSVPNYDDCISPNLNVIAKSLTEGCNNFTLESYYEDLKSVLRLYGLTELQKIYFDFLELYVVENPFGD